MSSIHENSHDDMDKDSLEENKATRVTYVRYQKTKENKKVLKFNLYNHHSLMTWCRNATHGSPHYQ